MEVGNCVCLQNRGVFGLYWSSFGPFWSISKPFLSIVNSFLRDIFELGPVPYSILRSVPWNVIKPRKMWKKKYRARVRCGAMDRNAPGESTRVQGETPFLPTAYGALLLKTERLRTKSIIFFSLFVLLLFGNCFNRELRFFLEFAFCCLNSPVGKWLLVFFINKFFHLLLPKNLYIRTTNRVLLERKNWWPDKDAKIWQWQWET